MKITIFQALAEMENGNCVTFYSPSLSAANRLTNTIRTAKSRMNRKFRSFGMPTSDKILKRNYEEESGTISFWLEEPEPIPTYEIVEKQ